MRGQGMAKGKNKTAEGALSLAGLQAVVTAGAAGIGRAIAIAFADHGARVMICDVDKRALAELKRARPDISAMQADVSKPGQVDKLFNRIGRRGRLDILVNNAGIAGPTARVEDILPADWERTLAVNLNG